MPPPAEGLTSRLFLGPALRAQPDGRLVTLVRGGYEAAFEEIVRRYGRPLGRYAASIVGGRSEDVLQEAFARALPALQRDGAEIDLRPWLFRIVRNTALNDLRDSPPTPELLAEALAGGRNPAEELEQRERLADLMRRLRELPEAQRAAIVMRELEGLGHEEIAAALGLSGGGARQAIYRARQALRDGAGLLLPLPLLRLLIDHGGDAAGAGAGGALATAGASAGGAGAGGALKLGVVAAVVAGSIGAGVAVKSHGGRSADEAQAAQAGRGVAPHARASSAARPARAGAALATARPRPRQGDSAAGSGAGHGWPSQAGPPAAAQQAGGRAGGPLQAPGPTRPRHRHPGGQEGDRHEGDLSPHAGGPGPDHGEHSGGGRGDSELGDGPRSGQDGTEAGAGEGTTGEDDPPRSADGGDSGGSGDQGGSGGSGGSDGSGDSEASGEGIARGAGGETGREYESP